MKIVCLSSGGLDSSVLMLMLKSEGHDIFPLYIDYGHKSSRMELNSYKKICDFLKIDPEVMELHDLAKIKSGLTDKSLSSIEHSFYPARNLLFLTIGAAYANNKDIKIIAMGLISNTVFPDQTQEFTKKAEMAISSALGYKIKILIPFIKMDKHEIIGLAKKYRLPLGMTYSCHEGHKKPCGKCTACKELIQVEKNN